MKVHNFLIPTFSGFYSTGWETIVDLLIENATDNLTQMEGIDADFVQRHVAPTSSSIRAIELEIAKHYAEVYCDAVLQYLDIYIEATAVEIDSPREYNFANDRLFITAEFEYTEDQLIIKLLKLIEDNYHKLKAIIKDEHSSCEGFWSFMDDDVKMWIHHVNNGDYDYIAYLIGHLLRIKCKHLNEVAMHSLSDIDVEVEFEGSPYQEKWEEMYDNAMRIRRERKSGNVHSPYCRGLTERAMNNPIETLIGRTIHYVDAYAEGNYSLTVSEVDESEYDVLFLGTDKNDKPAHKYIPLEIVYELVANGRAVRNKWGCFVRERKWTVE